MPSRSEDGWGQLEHAAFLIRGDGPAIGLPGELLDGELVLDLDAGLRRLARHFDHLARNWQAQLRGPSQDLAGYNRRLFVHRELARIYDGVLKLMLGDQEGSELLHLVYEE